MSKKLYLTSRIIGLTVKPIILLFANKYSYIEVAHEIALYYFLLAATLVLLNSELHKKFYGLVFNGGTKYAVRKEVEMYVKSTFQHVCYFSLVMFIFLSWYLDESKLAYLFVILIVIEKIWDERQRYYIFSKNYKRWSIWYLIKSMLLILAAIFSIIFNLKFIFCIAILMITYMFFFIKEFANSNAIIFIKSVQNLINLRKYWILYKENIMIAQIGALASANILQIDKWYLKTIVDKEFFIGLVIIGQIGAIFLVLIDNVFLALNRSKFVDIKTEYSSALNWTLLFVIFVLSFIVIGVGSELIIDIFEIKKINKELLILAVLVYMVNGVTMPLVEFVFWRYPRYYLTFCDVGAIIAACLTIEVVKVYSSSLEVVYLALIVLFVLRLVYYFILGLGYKRSMAC